MLNRSAAMEVLGRVEVQMMRIAGCGPQVLSISCDLELGVVFGVALGIFSVAVLLLTFSLHIPRTVLPLKPKDEELFNPSSLGDGELLHKTVPMHQWCVSLEDLRQFRRLVMHAVLQGKVQPSELDMFELSDLRIGPSVYSVTEQLVKPLTSLAGNMSWALLKNPEGLSCDVFVTHCWAEGIYEFLDRVEHSWPRGAKGAYICFLSNPQNSDISSLIASPSESPFALALRNAGVVLVLPNHRASIYTRLWCVYEAFLAYRWQKGIRTAERRHDGLWRCLVRTACLYAAGSAVVLLMLNTIIEYEDWYELDKSFFAPLIFAMLIFSISRFDCCGFLKQASLGIACIFSGVALSPAVLFRGYDNLTSVTIWLAVGLTLCVAEYDRMMISDVLLRSRFLVRGFSGRLMDAKCSVDADRQNIHQELQATGGEVEHAVNTLIHVNWLSPELQHVAALAGQLGDASYFSSTWLCCALGCWLIVPFNHFNDRYVATDTSKVCSAVTFVHGIVWLLLFIFLPHDRKVFASALIKVWIPAVLALLAVQQNWLWYPPLGALVLGPFCLLLSLAGPLRVARIPFLGIPLVQILIGKWGCRRSRGPLPGFAPQDQERSVESTSVEPMSQDLAVPCESEESVTIAF